MTSLQRTRSDGCESYPDAAETAHSINQARTKKSAAFQHITDEIYHLKRKLMECGITYEMLVRKSPVKREKIEKAANIAASLAHADEDCERFLQQGVYNGPLFMKRFVSRYRPYIIALIFIQKDGCNHLLEYLPKQEGIFS
ncbi:hypothetical protein ACFQPF_16475 [Fictibacillus iocasae]|uniref:Uncharacterized protein n=1 Tax=Fictibacillus iocasae TaxID=2715437 RepID=A0ABW2NWB0_9BACL